MDEQLVQLLRVAGRGFAAGAGLHIGASVLAGVANKKLMTTPLHFLRHVVTKDTLRFGCFFGLSAVAYRATLALLQKKAPHLRKYHALIAGAVAGVVSAIDSPGRRQTLTLFMLARALGMLVIILNRRGFLPNIPHFVAILYALCHGCIIVAVTRFPSLLPPNYYRAILRWSQYYTEEKIQVYFRRPSTHLIPCSALLHKGTCHSTALRDFFAGLWLYFKIYVTLYSLPMVILKGRQLFKFPVSSVDTLLRNSFRSALFFATDATICKYLLCLLRNAWGCPPPVPVPIPFLAGLSGVVGLLIERESRRVELLYYVIPQVLYSLAQLLKRGPLPVGHLPFGSTLLFSLSLSIILHAYKIERSAVAPFICRAVEFLLEES